MNARFLYVFISSCTEGFSSSLVSWSWHVVYNIYTDIHIRGNGKSPRNKIKCIPRVWWVVTGRGRGPCLLFPGSKHFPGYNCSRRRSSSSLLPSSLLSSPSAAHTANRNILCLPNTALSQPLWTDTTLRSIHWGVLYIYFIYFYSLKYLDFNKYL